MTTPRATCRKSGSALIAVVVYLLIVTSLSVAFFGTLHRAMSQARINEQHRQCRYLAEAGIEKALAELRAAPGVYRGEQNTPLGSGTFSVDVAPETAPGAYRIHATGALTDGQFVLAKCDETASVVFSGTRIRALRWEDRHQ